MEHITIKKLTAGTVYKVTAIGLVCAFVPFSVLMGVLSLFGSETVTWNDQAITGIKGLIASPFIGLFIAALFSAILGTALVLGLWIYSWFKPIDIRFIAGE